PLKPALFGRIRHELNSPNLRGHLPQHPTPAINSPLGAQKWAVVGKDNWTFYCAYSEVISEPHLPSKEANHLRPAFVVAKGKFLDRPARCERVKTLFNFI
ncbi:hypothetical protein AVEN_170148-1, partial [Araneus ventricosus]